MYPATKKRRNNGESLCRSIIALRDRHRLYGWNVPAADLDFVEYDHGRAVAVVEYKHEWERPIDCKTATIKAQIDLANRAGLPMLGVVHADDWSRFIVTALNSIGWKHLRNERPAEFVEREFVEWLYSLRGRPLPSLMQFSAQGTLTHDDNGRPITEE